MAGIFDAPRNAGTLCKSHVYLPSYALTYSSPRRPEAHWPRREGCQRPCLPDYRPNRTHILRPLGLGQNDG